MLHDELFLGLLAAFCWGIADFCARGATRLGGALLTLLTIQVIAVLALLVVAVPLGLLAWPHASPLLVVAAAFINLAILGGAALLYRAFAIGTLALVSPIAASFAALTALLAIASGERPSPLQLAGIILTLAGVTLASAAPAHLHSPDAKQVDEYPGEQRDENRMPLLAPGLLEALGALVVFGVAYWALRFVVGRLGGVPTAFIGKSADLLVLGVIALVGLLSQRRRSASVGATHWYVLRVPPGAFWGFVVPNALLDTLANIAYNLGIATALTSVVSVLSSLFSAVTVLLAWIFLRERLARWQWVGVVTILAGIALVST